MLISSEIAPLSKEPTNDIIRIHAVKKSQFSSIFKNANPNRDHLNVSELISYTLPAHKYYGGPPLPFLNGELRKYPENFHLERILSGN